MKSISSIKYKYPFNDFSTWLLIFSNLLAIFFAFIENWSLLLIIWIYWCQSVIIGFFNFIRILSLKDFSTNGFYINNKPVLPTRSTKIYTAFFFAAHYGFFHVVYALFISQANNIHGNINLSLDKKYIMLGAVVFFINHLFSFLYNRNRDRGKQNIGRVMFFPYARIIPMHLIIIFGAFTGKMAIVLFLFLKTLADVIMHVAEHD